MQAASQSTEAAMNNTIISQVAIQVLIAEWHRQYRNSDFRPTHFVFSDAKCEQTDSPR